ncbi:expressed unknown protein [Seminavis robusta]|uniref:G-protein coupled receptors family 1 profile domain-containing protein n=1 Tax=Seminavis robusta TaxID=568900 RepID=A0A9N8HSR3_9STRA|nr:expressed unknown protein [Seminavis robusta]|eukprot:Sro1418_g270950.1 n/a (488) ;mRNA; r:6700-8163
MSFYAIAEVENGIRLTDGNESDMFHNGISNYTTMMNDTIAYSNDDNTGLYTPAQQAVLGYVSVLTGLGSFLGSLTIAYVIYHDAKKGRRVTPFERLMLGIATSDCLSSFGMSAMGPWAVPSSVDYVFGAVGNWNTCDASGFFFSFINATSYYNLGLALYFLWTLRLEWRMETYAQRVEPLIHLVAWISSAGVSSASMVHKWYVPLYVLPGWCYFGVYPPRCNYYHEDGQHHCERGGDIICPNDILCPDQILLSLTAGTTGWLLCAVGITISMILLYLRVRHLDQRMQRYAGSSSDAFRRSRETGIQACLYILAYYMISFPGFLQRLFLGSFPDTTPHNRRLYFGFCFVTKFVAPMGGIFNCYIFLRKRLGRLMSDGECLSFVSTIRQSVFRASVGVTSSSVRTNPGDASSIQSHNNEVASVVNSNEASSVRSHHGNNNQQEEITKDTTDASKRKEDRQRYRLQMLELANSNDGFSEGDRESSAFSFH